MRSKLHSLCIALTLLAAGAAHAEVAETVIALPTSVKDGFGRTVEQDIQVTIFRESTRQRSPFLVLNHGRSVDAQGRAKLGRARSSANALYFVALGYAAFVPTRIGYGVSGGPDVEESGTCRNRNYPPAYEAGAKQTLDVIAYAKKQDYVDAARGLVVGQSFGGAIAIAVAAKNVAGVAGAVNFAGGGGGDPQGHPRQPCRPDLLAAMFASYGASAKTPTLWLYSANDQYMGEEAPKEWFKGFLASGGKGSFIPLPAHGADGHGSFSSNHAAWRPAFEAFLKGL